MEALRKLVIATATMSESQLREARRLAQGMSGDAKARELVVNLIDMFIAIGEDKDRRAKLAAACLLAIDEAERSSGSSSSKRPSFSSRSSSSRSGGGAGKVVGVVVVLGLIAGGYAFVNKGKEAAETPAPSSRTAQTAPTPAAPRAGIAPKPPAQPESALAPRAGEIGIAGTVKAWSGKTRLTATITRFSIPGEPWTPTSAPRLREIVIGSQTRVIGTDGATDDPQSLLKPGARLSVVGRDSGVGKPLTAREIRAE